MERNLIFDTEEKIKLPPILPSEEPKVSMSKKTMMTPSIVPLVPSITAYDSLSHMVKVEFKK